MRQPGRENESPQVRESAKKKRNDGRRLVKSEGKCLRGRTKEKI